jgi:hypothetical protein
MSRLWRQSKMPGAMPGIYVPSSPIAIDLRAG